MPWNTLLLPLLAGWVLLNFSSVTRPSARRYEGQRLVLISAAVGVCLLCVARMLTLIGGLAAPQLAARWAQFAPFEYSGVSAMTLVLAGVFVVLGNSFADSKDAYRRVIERRDDHLEQLFYRSIAKSDSLSFTLKSSMPHPSSEHRGYNCSVLGSAVPPA